MGTKAGTDTEQITDEDLITCWGLFHEALSETTPLLLQGIAPCGKDMSGPWFEVLLRLQRSPHHRLPMSQLAREVSLSSGGFTKLADRLERNGYLVRQACALDRRVTYATLTKKRAGPRGTGQDQARCPPSRVCAGPPRGARRARPSRTGAQTAGQLASRPRGAGEGLRLLWAARERPGGKS